MSSLFAESHNMVAILEKSDAAEGFEQIIDFLSGSYINHAFSVNPHVYISCIKQFWNTTVVKRSGDVTRVGKGFSGVETPLFESMLVVRDVAEEAEAQVLAQGDDVQEPAAEEVVTEVVPPTPTPPSPVIPSLPPHQPPCPPQPQDAEVSSLLFQQDVFIEATPIGRKVPVIDYEIVMINNKPRYKIIKADDTHQLYISFITLLKNFDREDLEDLWRIVKAKFSTSNPMDKMLYGEINRKISTFKIYIGQLVNVARLQVDEESKMSLELLRFIRKQLQEYQQGVSSTNLTAGSQGATPSNAGSQEDDSDSDDEPDVLIIQSTPTLVVPIIDEATTQNDGTEEAGRLGLAFPSLNLILGVGSSSIGSFISAGCTSLVSAGSTPSMSPCASPISADRHSISASKSHVFTGRPIGSVGRPVFVVRPSGFAVRTRVPASRILGKFTASASSERFPRASNVELLNINDGLKIFDCPKSGIFTSCSYDE
nr:hypothetical protein [Tanacetum cinerariifolium]